MASSECYLDVDREITDTEAERLRRSRTRTRYLQHTNKAVLRMFEKNIAANSRGRGEQLTDPVKGVFDKQLSDFDTMLERWKDPYDLEIILAEYLWSFDAILCNGNMEKVAAESQFMFELIPKSNKRLRSVYGETFFRPVTIGLRRPTNVKALAHVHES